MYDAWQNFFAMLGESAATLIGLLFWIGARHAGFFVALGLLALLAVAIRNAWDLVTWLAPQRETGG